MTAGSIAREGEAAVVETALPLPADVAQRYGVDNCPANRAIEALGDKWKLHIIIELGQNEHMRFGALQHALVGINQKVLTNALRGLERDGIVQRIAYAELPPRVEYLLTPRGRAALRVVEALHTWAESSGL